ncbi:MAG TPA: hypothetical protein VL284_06935 [Thermoanaerobaculia bacterium]|nr:hypothetical protein [Thermoanaerobaculia bacterium]
MSDEKQIRDYLLGAVDQTAAEGIETRALGEEEFYETVRSVEDDLFDDYAHGRLGASDREAFLRRFGSDSERVVFARALAGRRANVVAFPARRWAGWAAAAAILIAITAVWITREPSPPASVARVQSNAPLMRSIAVTVAIGGSRSASAPVQVAVPRGVSTVDLHVRLNPNDRFGSYVVTLRSKSVSWGSGDLHAALTGGDLIVTAPVPAAVLEEGSYELGISGGGEELGFASLEVRRTR